MEYKRVLFLLPRRTHHHHLLLLATFYSFYKDSSQELQTLTTLPCSVISPSSVSTVVPANRKWPKSFRGYCLWRPLNINYIKVILQSFKVVKTKKKIFIQIFQNKLTSTLVLKKVILLKHEDLYLRTKKNKPGEKEKEMYCCYCLTTPLIIRWQNKIIATLKAI